MASKTYYEKLKDPRWQKNRLEVMSANNFTCELCGDAESTLNVHHKEYFKGMEPWEYDSKQLACICESCHEWHHDNLDLLKFVCSYANLDGPNNRTQLAFVMAGFTAMPYEGILSVSCLPDTVSFYQAYLAGVQAASLYENGIKEPIDNEGKGDGQS
jgi:hypothetical protein